MSYSQLHISIISNIIFEPYFNKLIKLQFGEKCDASYIPYGEHKDTVYQKHISKSNIIIVWLNFEAFFPDIWNSLFSQKKRELEVIDDVYILCEKLRTDLATISNTQILWFLFEDYSIKFATALGHKPICEDLVNRINIKLYDNFNESIFLIDLKRLISNIGIINSYSHKNKYRWNAPYSKALIEIAIKEIYKQHLIEKGITKKCLILDCDNVLWGGILSEDGIENIKLGGSGLGRAYQDFQRYVLSLYYHGVILAICSKNDFSDVITMFNKHSEMILKYEHIACYQVNWDNKPDNIRKIAKTLNISLDSMVFIDDSPFEIEATKAILPEVTTVIYDNETIYDQLSCFNLKNNANIINIEKRNETYRTNKSRELLKSQFNSYEDYISALDTKLDIHEAAPIEFNRISELTQRTNKCTNGRRYTVAEIKERINNNALYSIYASDRFSNLGLIGAIEVCDDTLSLFALSCRALGRGIENKILEFINDKYQIKRINFMSTNKNDDIKILLLKEFHNSFIIKC